MTDRQGPLYPAGVCYSDHLPMGIDSWTPCFGTGRDGW